MAGKTEGDIQRSIMLAIQQAFPTALILRQNTGVARDPRGQVIKFGTPGQGDLRCVIDGLAIEIEVKTETGRQSKAQKNYEAALRRAGGIYILARSPEDALEQLRCQMNSPGNY